MRCKGNGARSASSPYSIGTDITITPYLSRGNLICTYMAVVSFGRETEGVVKDETNCQSGGKTYRPRNELLPYGVELDEPLFEVYGAPL